MPLLRQDVEIMHGMRRDGEDGGKLTFIGMIAYRARMIRQWRRIMARRDDMGSIRDELESRELDKVIKDERERKRVDREHKKMLKKKRQAKCPHCGK